MIDLHTHTDASDGTLCPAAVVELAHKTGLQALAMTDHDTFAGYDQVAPMAHAFDLQLVCGIEMSTNYRGQSVHLLGYFLRQQPSKDFREWILGLQSSRRARNQKLVAKLQSMGIGITLQELMERGRNLPGRPHLAALMLEKGYVQSAQEAFDRYLDESASCYVSRNEPEFGDSVARIAREGGLPCLPHPKRITCDRNLLEEYLLEMKNMGLCGIEAYHSDHSVQDSLLYISLAKQLGLEITGGSDFHGVLKPGIQLGLGRSGNLNIPTSLLDRLRML